MSSKASVFVNVIKPSEFDQALSARKRASECVISASATLCALALYMASGAHLWASALAVTAIAVTGASERITGRPGGCGERDGTYSSSSGTSSPSRLSVETGIGLVQRRVLAALTIWCVRSPSRPRHHLPAGRSGGHRPYGENGSAKVCHGSGGIVLLRAE